MAAADLRALVDSLSDGSADAATVADIADVFANFSTEMLQKASDVIAAAAVVAVTTTATATTAATDLPLSDASVNRTLEMHCLLQRQQQQQQLQQQHNVSVIAEAAAAAATNGSHQAIDPTTAAALSCPISFDSVLCWPQTGSGLWAVLPCFEEFKGVHYDTTQNATRFCLPNGTWDTYSNYDKCHHASPLPVPDFAPNVELPAYIYCCGYFISFAALILALIVFLCFKDLKCLRNTIHANLFLTYILSALLWILTLFLQVMTDHASQAGCITLVMMFHYFNLTNFFWMFVEGLYLYTLVVQTFSSENISFLMYAFIGWGCPAIVVFIWSIAKVFAPPLETEHFNGLDIECSWMRESHIDWIFQGPASLVLLLNSIFLIRIMWVLITKLRSANTLETRQYRKASKALLVLIPLFGITYLIVLTGPEQGMSRNLFESLRAFLISTQGFFVSLFFCFLNSEVRQTLRHHIDRWRDNRNLRRGNSQRNRRYRLSKDYSQRSRTESLRLTSTSPIAAGHNE